jgi:IS4 transposase
VLVGVLVGPLPRTEGRHQTAHQLYVRGPIPKFIDVSEGKLHDLKILDVIAPEPGSFYVMDRAYVNFGRLHVFHDGGASFVTHPKRGILFRRRYSHPIDATAGVRSDHTVVLASAASRKDYPDPLRRIHFHDVERDRSLRFITNNFDRPALTICLLYNSRWQVELFFKWTEQHLRIKAFYGYSENADKTQIWIEVAVYVLVAILKKRLALEASSHETLQVLSVTLFEQVPILQAFDDVESQEKSLGFSNQLNLWDL